MESVFFIALITFFILSIVLIILIIYEYVQIRKYNTQFVFLATAISEVAEVINKNVESARSETVILRENTVEIAIIKQILSLHSNMLSYNMPTKEWDELLTAIKQLDTKEK